MSTSPRPNVFTMPPWAIDPMSRWVTVKEFAKLYRKSTRRIYELCNNGDIIVFQVATYRDPMGRWWIRLPE